MDAQVASFGKHQTRLITYILIDRLCYSGNCLKNLYFLYFVVYYLIYGALQLLCCIYCSLWAKLQNTGPFSYISFHITSLHNNTV